MSSKSRNCGYVDNLVFSYPSGVRFWGQIEFYLSPKSTLAAYPQLVIFSAVSPPIL